MVQKKLPLINSAHGSETRNIINELIKLFNGMGYTYNESLQKAHDVLDEAERVNKENVSTQKQVDELILHAGQSDAEVIQARGGLPLLKDRLDESDEQLAQIKNKTTHIVNVADFDAVGYAEWDETDKIQEAIDYVASLGGGTVQFNNSTYHVQGLVPRNNVLLKGTGRSKLKLFKDATTHMIYYNDAETLSHFDIKDMVLDGDSQTDYDVIHITEPSPSAPKKTWYMSTLDNVEVVYGKAGIYCPVPGSVKIINSHVAYNDVGIKQEREHFYVTNTVVWGNRIGADIGGANHFTWHNALIAHNTEKGIISNPSSQPYAFENGFIGCNFIDNPTCIDGKFQYIRFIGCRFIDSGIGIRGLGLQNVVTGCEFARLNTAIQFDDNSVPEENIVSSCVFKQNNVDIVARGHNASLQSNVFSNTKTMSIKTEGDAMFGLNIQNNNFNNVSEDGDNLYPCVQINEGIHATIISNNIFRNTGSGKASHGIWFEPTLTQASVSDTMVANNVARTMKTIGYQLKENVTEVNNVGDVVTV